MVSSKDGTDTSCRERNTSHNSQRLLAIVCDIIVKSAIKIVLMAITKSECLNRKCDRSDQMPGSSVDHGHGEDSSFMQVCLGSGL